MRRAAAGATGGPSPDASAAPGRRDRARRSLAGHGTP